MIWLDLAWFGEWNSGRTQMRMIFIRMILAKLNDYGWDVGCAAQVSYFSISRSIIHLIIDFHDHFDCLNCRVHSFVFTTLFIIFFGPFDQQQLYQFTWTLWLCDRKNAAQNLTINLSRIVHVDPLSNIIIRIWILFATVQTQTYLLRCDNESPCVYVNWKINNDQLSNRCVVENILRVNWHDSSCFK